MSMVSCLPLRLPFSLGSDLKPESFLSSGTEENEVIKLIDFGFAKSFVDQKVTP